jgi:hypothetical protein
MYHVVKIEEDDRCNLGPPLKYSSGTRHLIWLLLKYIQSWCGITNILSLLMLPCDFSYLFIILILHLVVTFFFLFFFNMFIQEEEENSN